MKSSQLVVFLVAALTLRSCQSVLVDPEDSEECLDLEECPGGGTLTNVALRKPAVQSSVYLEFDATKAVDGNTNKWFWDGSSCSHTSDSETENDKFPWLRVDLQAPHAVHYVKLYTREDPCCADRYHDIEVRVGNELEDGKNVLFSENNLCATHLRGGKPGDIFNLTCAPCLVGRYVSVQITKLCDTCMNSKISVLTLCELEIVGEKLI